MLCPKEKDAVMNYKFDTNCSDKNRRIVWAKIRGSPWWPALTIHPSDCGRSYVQHGHSWVFWFGDHQISLVCKKDIRDFITCFQKMVSMSSKKLRHKAIKEAVELLATVRGVASDHQDLVVWANKGFIDLNPESNSFPSLPPLIEKYLTTVETSSESESESSLSDFEMIDSSSGICYENLKTGFLKLEEMCIACRATNVDTMSEHPLFKGRICSRCKMNAKETLFVLGDDGKNICCIICGRPGLLVVCDSCPKSYCERCLTLFLSPELINNIKETESWLCYFCSNVDVKDGFLQPHADWENRIFSLFNFNSQISIKNFNKKKPISVLSLFDGISTGKLVLDMLGIVVDKYYASEIDETALNVSKLHHTNSIEYIGDVNTLTEMKIRSLGHIDLVLAGSPCNDLSLVNPLRKGLYDWSGTGCLFFDFVFVLNEVRRINKNVFYLFENVAAMEQITKETICSFLMHEPAVINAEDVSPQKRCRYFWGNIPGMHVAQKFWNKTETVEFDGHSLDQFVLPNLGRKATVKKINTVTTNKHSLVQQHGSLMPVSMNGTPDFLWVTELEKIFGFPVHYTDTGNLGIRERRALLGRSWSVPVILSILQPLKHFFEVK